jgi:hypothetical protein
LADAENDRDRRSCSFRRARSRCAGGRGDQGHSTTNQIAQQCWQLIVFPFEPVVLDPDILALDKTGVVEAFAESSHKWRGGIGRPAIYKSDDRWRRCWARAASGNTAAVPPMRVMNSRRLHEPSPSLRTRLYHIRESYCSSQQNLPLDFRNGSKARITAPQHCCLLYPS